MSLFCFLACLHILPFLITEVGIESDSKRITRAQCYIIDIAASVAYTMEIYFGDSYNKCLILVNSSISRCQRSLGKFYSANLSVST